MPGQVPSKKKKKYSGRGSGLMLKEDDFGYRDDGQGLADLTPKQVAFFAALMVNGGHIRKACEEVKYEYSYGRALVSKHPLIRTAIKQFREKMKSSLADWVEMVPRAKAK